MRGRVTSFVWCLAGGACFWAARAYAQNRAELRPPSAFAGMSDQQARSRALFTEAAKVIMNPRCMNCHPASDRPTQGNDMHPASAARSRAGPTAAACPATPAAPATWIATSRFSPASRPPSKACRGIRAGAWRRSRWRGKASRSGEICRQIKDPQRNGGRNLALLHEHLAHDDLVGWAWKPGPGRDPAPGTQERLGELVQAWIDSGATCP